MSDPVIYSAPTGRRVGDSTLPPDHLGTVYGIPAASDEIVELLRKNLQEIDEADLDHVRKRRWINTKTGEEFEHIKAYVDPVSPTNAGAVSFAQCGDSILYLRPADAVEKSETVTLGELRSWRV